MGKGARRTATDELSVEALRRGLTYRASRVSRKQNAPWTRRARAVWPAVRRGTRVRRSLVAVCSAVVLATPAGAQIMRLPQAVGPEPEWWFSGTIAFLQPIGVPDDDRGAYWSFRSVTGYRITIERSVGAGTTLGVAALLTSPGLTLRSTLAGCPTGCDASAQMQSLGLAYRASGVGEGTHSVFELDGGVVRVTDIANSAGGTPYQPNSRTIPFASAAYGLAYATSSRFQIELVQEYRFLFAGSGVRDASQQSITRIALRIGVGVRSGY